MLFEQIKLTSENDTGASEQLRQRLLEPLMEEANYKGMRISELTALCQQNEKQQQSCFNGIALTIVGLHPDVLTLFAPGIDAGMGPAYEHALKHINLRV